MRIGIIGGSVFTGVATPNSTTIFQAVVLLVISLILGLFEKEGLLQPALIP